MGLCCQSNDPGVLPAERLGTNCVGGWVGQRASREECGIYRTHGARSLDLPDRSESLYGLRFPDPIIQWVQEIKRPKGETENQQ